MTSAAKPPILAFAFIILLALAVQAGMVYAGVTPVLQGRLPDTDNYIWLLRAEALVRGDGWFNHTLMRMNAPYGDVLNWSRPIDVLIVALSAPLRLFMDWHEAIFWGGAALPVLLHLILGMVCVWVFAPFLPALAWPLLMLFVLVQPNLVGYSLFGRPDQPILLLILTMLALGALSRGVLTGRGLRYGFWAGLWFGGALWVSPESLFTLLIISGLFAALWVWRGGRKFLDLMAGQAFGFFFAVLVALLIERGGTAFSVVELDKISAVHLLMAAVNLLVWLPLRDRAGAGWLPRGMAISVSAAIAVTALAMLQPSALLGPTGDIHPRVMAEFFLNIREMQPLWPANLEKTGAFFLFLGAPLLAVGLWVWAAYRGRLEQPPVAWLPLVVPTVVMLGAALIHARFSMLAAPLGAGLLIVLCERLFDSGKPDKTDIARALLRVAFLTAPFMLSVGAVSFVPDSAAEETDVAGKACRPFDLRQTLAARAPTIIMAPLNYGPELLYFTPHGVVAGPYHRNWPGIIDASDFFNARDDGVAQAILARRGIGLVLYCAHDTGVNVPPDALIARLERGQGPPWLRAETVPETTDFRLFTVLQTP